MQLSYTLYLDGPDVRIIKAALADYRKKCEAGVAVGHDHPFAADIRWLDILEPKLVALRPDGFED